MEAQDLRVGNYIQFKINKRLLKVLPNHIQNILDGFYSHTIEPIPLTEEWLLKLGFEKEDCFYFKKEVWFELVENCQLRLDGLDLKK